MGGGEDEEVLPGELVADGVEEGEAFGFEFGADFADAHFVVGADGDGGVLFAVLEEDQAAGGLEGAADVGEHGAGLGELVIDVDQEDEVHFVAGEMGVGGVAEDGAVVAETGVVHAGAEEAEHAGLDVVGVDEAGGDEGGDSFDVVAAAGADVGDVHAGAEAEEGDGAGGVFLLLAFGAVEPGGAAHAHDGGDGASGGGMGGGGGGLGRGGERSAEGEEGEEDPQVSLRFYRHTV